MNVNRQKQLSEMWKHNMQEIDDTMVSSGETRYYERMRSEWTRMVEKLGEPFSMDDLTQIKFTQRKFCKEPNRTFVFKEMITHLQKKGYITAQEMEQLKRNVTIMPDEIQFQSNQNRDLFTRVVKKVQQEFSDNKLPEEFQDEEYIRGLFYKLNERKLLESMAFGLNMTVEDINFFLIKIFHNKGLDDNIPDEFLLSIVLQGESAENVSRYQQFMALKKYYAAMESDPMEIRSDETVDVRGMQLFRGEQCTDETINPDLCRILQGYDRQHMRINQLVKEFQEIPAYQYVIRYLFSKMDFSDMAVEPEMFFQEIRQDRIGNTGSGQEDFSVLVHRVDFSDGRALDSREAFQKMVQRVQERFKGCGLPDDFCGESYIEELILNLDEKKLLESMVFGLDMTVETVNIFLTKVLKRSELDYYAPEEYLLAIVLNNSKYDDRPRYPQYISLKKYYEAMEVNLEESVIEPENTRSIFDEADISFAEKTELFKGAECTDESIHPKLKEMLARHHLIRKKLRQAKNGKTFEFRTADKEFFDLMEKVQRRYNGKISMYKEIQGEMEDSALLIQRKSAAGIVRIQYEPDTEIKLKRGCRFYGLSQKDPKNPICFILDQDVLLPARKSIKLILPVRSMTEKPDKAKKKEFVENKVFQVKSHIEGIISAKSGDKNKPHYYKVSGKKPDKGTIEIECKPGTVIAKGTRFTYTENGDVYEFESIEDMTVHTIHDITVCCKLLNEHGKVVDDWVRATEYFMEIGKRKTTNTNNKSTVYYTLAETNTVCHMEPAVDGVIKVWNPKPINYERENAAVINYQTDKFLPFYQYMYGAYKTDYFDQIFDEVDGSLFGGWFTSTEITYSTMNEEQFSKKKSSKKRNDMLTLIFLIYVRECELNNELPKYHRFRKQVNETMQKCRLQRLYLGNPYDCLLVYFLAYDSPVDVLREIWTVVKNTKGTKRREA